MIFKLVMKNIFEKKARTFLIVFSIMLSAMLLFLSITISATLVGIHTDQIRKQLGNADIVIVEGEKLEYKYFSMDSTRLVQDKTEYIVGGIIGDGYHTNDLDTRTISLYGLNLEDLAVFNPIEYAKEPISGVFDGEKIIISDAFAEELDVQVGDSIDLDIMDQIHTFEVYAITYPVGLFSDGLQDLQAILPLETLSNILGSDGDVGIICVKLNNIEDMGEVIEELSELYPNNSVREAVSGEEINQKVGVLSMSFTIISIIVVLLSAFIIISSFHVIVLERLPIYGIFRSVGAQKSTVAKMILLESGIYGVLGGLLGCISGIVALNYLSSAMSPAWMNVKASYSIVDILITFIGAALLSIMASIIPTLRVSKISLKDIILGGYFKVKKNSIRKLIVGLLLIVARVVLPNIVSIKNAMLVNTLCLVLVVVGTVFIMPYVLNISARVLGVFNKLLFGNEGSIATLNVRNNANLLNSTILLTIGIASLLLINIVTSNILTGMAEVFTDVSKFDIYAMVKTTDSDLEEKVSGVDGVTDAFGFYGELGVYVVNKNDDISIIEGVDPERYLDFTDIEFEDGIETLRDLKNGKNILLSTMVQKKMDLNLGDIITLSTEVGNVDYTIIGFFDSTLYGSNFGIVWENNLKEDMLIEGFTYMYFNTDSDVEITIDEIKRQFPDSFLDVNSIEELISNDKQSNGMVFYLLNAFSVLSMLIGIFGIVNNLLINLIERRRWIAMMKAVGMSKGQLIKMILVEALTIGLTGSIAGAMAGVSMLKLIPNIMISMGLYYDINISIQTVILYVLAGVLVMVIASISPAAKASKLNIIESITYE